MLSLLISIICLYALWPGTSPERLFLNMSAGRNGQATSQHPPHRASSSRLIAYYTYDCGLGPSPLCLKLASPSTASGSAEPGNETPSWRLMLSPCKLTNGVISVGMLAMWLQPRPSSCRRCRPVRGTSRHSNSVSDMCKLTSWCKADRAVANARNHGLGHL